MRNERPDECLPRRRIVMSIYYVGSGPVATVVPDVLSLLVYLWIVQLILPA